MNACWWPSVISPYSGRLIRAAKRMAFNLEAPWIALYVNTGDVLKPEDQENLQKNLALARELGAEVISIVDTSLTDAIQVICRDKNVTQIVMGRRNGGFSGFHRPWHATRSIGPHHEQN